MKVSKIPKPSLAACLSLLLPHCPELDEIRLVKALRAYPLNAVLKEAEPLVTVGSAITVREVARRLNVSRTKIFQLMKSGALPKIKLGARTVRIAERDVVRLTIPAPNKGA